jgi:serine/threonine protein kinase, bacterial
MRTGLHYPYSVAVNSAGNVYVADSGNNRVLMLPAGSTTQTVLPFGPLNHLNDVAADSAGNVYVTDHGNDRVLMLAAGAAAPKVLPFSGLRFTVWVAVDAGAACMSPTGDGCLCWRRALRRRPNCRSPA